MYSQEGVTVLGKRRTRNPVQNDDGRYPSDVAVRVFLDTDQCRAFALNVSESGACLTGLGRMAEGTRVTIRFLHLCIQARIAWSSDVATGVAFSRPLAPADLERFRRTAVGATGV